MACSKPVSCDGNEDLDDFFIMFAAQRTALYAKQREVLRVLQDIEVLEQERENAETQCRQLVATAVRLCSRERHVWSHPRAQSWYEETLPHFPESLFRGNFRLNRCTFRYIVSVCKSLARQDTNKRRAIPLEKRVAIGLYRLATSAEDRTNRGTCVSLQHKGWQSTCVSSPLLQGFLKELAPCMVVILKSALRKNTPPTTLTMRGGTVQFFSLLLITNTDLCT
ncbi:hypothetical protein HPB49_002956 [Dermacentor silvarum]|uniref:Uncharacterized protein n=1 Tax=Dermacentor silvarum TaxID=543639 RepID=A0ACB8DU14_DERSI|nr:hypothetical protein HPB49_002956 [Dermacentor silvarum]